ncbi:MAG: sugar transferase, partial [Lachnospiraceae bacterium]|nr:sugar transferase [Lachnospiraceae bacterium]
KFRETMPEFAYRMKVKAGITGYAQLYGKYNTLPYDKLKFDLYYIEQYSLWLDIKLMILTLKILFTRESTEGAGEDIVAGEVKE